MGAEPWSWPQNIHLVARWLSTLDKKVERYSTGSHEDYRVFISAEPAPSPESHIIPQGILENAIKITNEPPTGMHANLHKALDLFTQVRRPPLRCAGPAGGPHTLKPDTKAALACTAGEQALNPEDRPTLVPAAPCHPQHMHVHTSHPKINIFLED